MLCYLNQNNFPRQYADLFWAHSAGQLRPAASLLSQKPFVSNQNSKLWQKGVSVDWMFLSTIFTLALSKLRLIPTMSIKWLQSQHQFYPRLDVHFCFIFSLLLWAWRGLHARTGLHFTTMSLIILSGSQQQQTKQWDEEHNQIAREDHVFIYISSFFCQLKLSAPCGCQNCANFPRCSLHFLRVSHNITRIN